MSSGARHVDNLSDYEWLKELPPSPPAPTLMSGGDVDVEESAPAATVTYRPGTDVESTSEYTVGQLFPQEAREYLLSREPGDVTLIDRRVTLTTRDTEEHADHLLFYHAAIEMTDTLLVDLQSQCDCGACDICVKRVEIAEGRRRVTITDLSPYTHQRWVWYALKASSVTGAYNGARLFWMADREWHREKMLETVSPYILDYAYPTSDKGKAIRNLHDRIGQIVNGEARRSADAAERRRAHDEWNVERSR